MPWPTPFHALRAPGLAHRLVAEQNHLKSGWPRLSHVVVDQGRLVAAALLTTAAAHVQRLAFPRVTCRRRRAVPRDGVYSLGGALRGGTTCGHAEIWLGEAALL